MTIIDYQNQVCRHAMCICYLFWFMPILWQCYVIDDSLMWFIYYNLRIQQKDRLKKTKCFSIWWWQACYWTWTPEESSTYTGQTTSYCQLCFLMLWRRFCSTACVQLVRNWTRMIAYNYKHYNLIYIGSHTFFDIFIAIL